MTAFFCLVSPHRFVAASLIALVCAAPGFAQSVSPAPRNLVNTKFATVSSGAQSVLRVPVRGDATDADTRAAIAKRLRATWKAQGAAVSHSLTAWDKNGRGVAAVSTIVQVEKNGKPVTRAWRERTRAVGDGTLTFRYTDWSEQDRRLIERLITEFYPRIEAVYGKAAVSGEVEIVNLGTIESARGTDRQRLSFGAYDASNNRILLPIYESQDSFAQALLLNLIHAFHGPAVLQYDAWEQGFARAAASVVARTPDFGFEDGSGNYLLSLLEFYDLLNQPGLGNPTFFPPAQANVELEGQFSLGKMTFPRLGMSGAAWLKVYIENPNFFRQFNEAYYAQFDPAASPSLAGNVPALKSLAAPFLPDGVEGLPFDQWFRRQYILDSSVSVGRKLYAFVNPGIYREPNGQANAVQVMYFRTKPNGDEDLLNGRVYATYHDATGATIRLGAASEQVELAGGEGSITTQSLQPREGRLTLDFAIGTETARTYLPGGFNGDFQGVILGTGATGRDLTITQTTSTGTRNQTTRTEEAAFAVNLGTGENDLAKSVISYTDATGAVRTFRKNTGDGQAYVILRPDQNGGDVSTVTHTFAVGVAPYFVSFPLQPLTTAVPEALGLPVSDFVLTRWDTLESRYGSVTTDPNTSTSGALTPGRAYWFKPAPVDRSRPEAAVRITGIAPVTDVDFATVARYGWNMIGSPFTSDTTDVSDILVQFQNNQTYEWADAVAQGLVADGAYRFDRVSGQFVETDSINAPQWEGVFVRVLVPGEVTLLLPAPDAVTRKATAPTRAANTAPAKPDWSVTLRTRQEISPQAGFFGREAAATFGTAKGATDGYDNRLDREEPPAAVPGVGVAFDAPSRTTTAKSTGGRFVSDFRDAAKRSNSWAFTSLAAVPGTVQLQWANLGTVPRNTQLTLTDTETGAKIALRNRSSYSWNATDTKRSRRFTITASPTRTTPLALTNVAITRIGGRGVRGSGYGVSYNVTADADVTVELMAFGGKVVSRLDTAGRASRIGRQQVLWNGRAADGSALPAGSYNVRITATPVDRGDAPVTIIRPVMVLN